MRIFLNVLRFRDESVSVSECANEKVRERRLQVLTKRQRESVIVRKKQRERESNC